MQSLSTSGILWRFCFGLSVAALITWVVLHLSHSQPDLVPLVRWTIAGSLSLAMIFGIADYGFKQFLHEFPESLKISFVQIRGSKLRSALTALGVIIGIVAVTLMGTAIEGINVGVDRSFSGFGDDLLYVTKTPWTDRQEWWNYRNRPPIRYSYAQEINDWIADNPDSALKLAVPTENTLTTLIRGENRLNNIWTLGTTADYSRITRSDMKEGRFFSDFEAQSGSNVAVVGFDVADALFPSESAVGKTIQIRDQNFKILGVMARQGSFLGLFSWDSMLAMPITTYRRYYRVDDNGEVRVQVDSTRMQDARDELTGLMRRIRQLNPEQKDNFSINEQGTIRAQLDPIENGIALAGLFITGLALFVGAIGIMNITYVSVKERTKEIGTRKALGARRRTILLQFLIEAVTICFIGGVVGLISARVLTAVIAMVAPNFPLVFSVELVLTGLAISVLTGVVSGFAPALSASKLDPVVALRYE
ncbi:MAG TPA: ABC transporter permease [Lacunisphaera sp.]|jgi:putative ABC transport system permease protein